MNIELPDYEKSHKPRSNTFDEFCKEFDQRMELAKLNNDAGYPPKPQVTNEAPRKESLSVSLNDFSLSFTVANIYKFRKLQRNKKRQRLN